MDSHRPEDPELQEKIKQVTEIAKVTEDRAAMALHSREYDVAQAIALLTEDDGQSLDAEWAQAGRKRKKKSAQKAAKDKGNGKGARQAGGGGDGAKKNELDKANGKKNESSDVQTETRKGEKGGKGGRRGRTDSGKENEESVGPRSRLSRSTSVAESASGGLGPNRLGGGGDRMFSRRTRSDDYIAINVRRNNQAEATTDAAPPNVSNEVPVATAGNNEEYTASSADERESTSSARTEPGRRPALIDVTNTWRRNLSFRIRLPNVPANVENRSEIPNEVARDTSPSDGVTCGSVQDVTLDRVVGNLDSEVSNNPGANPVASLQSSSCTNSNQIGLSNQALPQRQNVQQPLARNTSKIPSSAVEMPDPFVITLDIQFGDLNFGFYSSSSNLDSNSISSQNQSQPKNQSDEPSPCPAAVTAGSTTGSASVSYGTGAPGFVATPGAQPIASHVSGDNSSAVETPGVPVAPPQQPTLPTQVGQQPAYHTMNSMTAHGVQPAVPSEVPSVISPAQVASSVQPGGVETAANTSVPESCPSEGGNVSPEDQQSLEARSLFDKLLADDNVGMSHKEKRKALLKFKKDHPDIWLEREDAAEEKLRELKEAMNSETCWPKMKGFNIFKRF